MADQLTREDVIRIAKEHGVDPALALAHWAQESSSGANPTDSVSGAVGHFQLMPDTFAQMYPEGDINNPQHNAQAGIRYLKHLGERFPGNREAQIGAYFAGPGKVEQFGGDISKMGDVKDPTGTSVPDYVSGVLDKYKKQLRTVTGLDGKQYTFPPDATDDEIVAFFDAMHPPAAQADVRKSEPVLPAMEQQTQDEQVWENARRAWRSATGGRLKGGQTEDQAVTEFTGIRNPRETANAAELTHLKETGELAPDRESGLYTGAKTAASIAGWVLGGPVGATAGEGAVRAVSLIYRLWQGVEGGAISLDAAAELGYNELIKGMGTDLAFNVGAGILGQVIAKIPGARPLVEKIGELLRRKFGMPAAAAQTSQTDLKVGKLADLTDNPAGKAAVAEIARRTEGVIPTPGQVTGTADGGELATRVMHPGIFERANKEIVSAVDNLHAATVNPQITNAPLEQGMGQSTRQQMGYQIQQMIKDAIKTVKTRLRPDFEAANNIGVTVDMEPVRKLAQEALDADALVLGGKLSAQERSDLQKIAKPLNTYEDFGDLSPVNPVRPTLVSAESALDFISRQKEKIRGLTGDHVPTEEFLITLGDMTRAADEAYVKAASSEAVVKAGKGDILAKLMLARQQYREMNKTVYSDALKKAMQADPENVGRMFWSAGTTSEMGKLGDLFDILKREGTMNEAQVIKLQKDITRGFLQEAVPTIEAAANWSKTLRENPLRRDTWNILTSDGGSQLKNAMDVLEQASQIALRDNKALTGAATSQLIPWSRVAKVIGFSYITGTVNIPLIAIGLSAERLTRLIATAYTQGDKGTINLIMRALRSNSANTAAGAKALQETLPLLQKAAEKYGEDVFVTEQQQGQQ